MKMATNRLIGASLGFLVFLSNTATGEYSPRDFFSKASPETFYTEDEMSVQDKEAIVRGGFRPSPSFTCSAWGIAEESPSSLTLKICPDSFVLIQVFPEKSGDALVAVESNRSSGRAVELRFFKVGAKNDSFTELSEDQLKALGLEPIDENDLLSEKMRFPAGTAQRAYLRLDERRRPTATVDTWNDPRWEKRTVTYAISFEWNGSRFDKRITPKR